MAEISKPSKMGVIWASAGDILDPGDTKYEIGWQVEIPPRQWENFVQNKQDQFNAHVNQHGVPAWDNTTSYVADKSYVQGSSGQVFRAVQDNVNQDPELDAANTYWQGAFASPGDFYTKTEADTTFLKKANNLSDVANVTTAQTNLNVYDKNVTYTKVEVDAKTTVASTAQAQAGTSNTVLMTPLRTKDYANSNLLGMSQTWQDVKASRVANTIYTNTTGKPIMVNVMVTGNDANTLYVNGVVVGVINGESNVGSCISAVVPNGSTYNTNFTPSIWAELR